MRQGCSTWALAIDGQSQVANGLAGGRLVRILRNFEPVNVPIQPVYSHLLQRSAPVRAFIQWAGPQLEKLIPDPDSQ